MAHQHQQPHFMASTVTRQKHVGAISSPATPIVLSPSLHSKPFYGGTGGRSRHAKGTFSAFTYETAGPNQPLSNDSSTAAHRWRGIDHNGAPTAVHRGVSSLRARTTEQGTTGTNVPIANATLANEKELNWEPNPYTNGGMMVTDHFRQRHEGLQGVKNKQRTIQALHQTNHWSLGGNNYHTLFDPTVRSISRDMEVPVDQSLAESLHRTRVPHRSPFRSAGNATSSFVTHERGFIGGHGQFPYHYSEYSLSEKSLMDTQEAGGRGFRPVCAHQIHHPMKATTVRSSLPQETDRNANFHAIQAPDETCRHRCNEVLQQARTRSAGPKTNGPARF